ncbi:hypothetical protein Tco_1383139 [Tanacetum coccineum]
MQTQEGMVNESIALDDDAERARVDKVVSDIKNVAVGHSYDNDTFTEVHHSNHDTFENVFAFGIQNNEKQVENYTKVNREAQQANDSLTKELEMYKDKEKHFTKETTTESNLCKKIKLLNDEISNLKSQACQKEKSFHGENEKYADLPMKYFCFVKHSMLNFEKQTVSKQEIKRDEFFTPWNHDNAVMTKIQKQLSNEFEMLAIDINLQLNCFEKSLVKEIKDDLKYAMSLEDEFDEKYLILDIQTDFFKTQFESTISESYSHVYENEMFEQNSSLESKNHCLKKTIAQFQQYFSKLKAHCINLELQLQNNVLKSGQHGQFLKAKSNEAKVQNDIDEIETINIELEHNVAKLLSEIKHLHKDNEHLKKTYKDLYDYKKDTRQKFYPNKTSVVYVKTTPPRSGLTWKLTGEIFTFVGLRWILTGKTVACLNTNDSAIPLGKETCSSNTMICANSSSLSAGLVDGETTPFQLGRIQGHMLILKAQRYIQGINQDLKKALNFKIHFHHSHHVHHLRQHHHHLSRQFLGIVVLSRLAAFSDTVFAIKKSM